MKDHMARYELASEHCTGKRVLDVATGTGYGANILRKRGAAEVVAVDREQAALDYGRERYGEDGLQWVNADAYALPFDKEFDVVVSFETIEHLTEPERFVEQCKSVLRPGGTYLVSTPVNTGGSFVSPYHELEFSVDEFRGLLTRHFPSVKILGQRRELSMAIKPLGNLPWRYWNKTFESGQGSHKLFTLMDRVNKVPNYLLAWAMGLGEKVREQTKPIDEPIRKSFLLKPQYYVMIGICKVD